MNTTNQYNISLYVNSIYPYTESESKALILILKQIKENKEKERLLILSSDIFNRIKEDVINIYFGEINDKENTIIKSAIKPKVNSHTSSYNEAISRLTSTPFKLNDSSPWNILFRESYEQAVKDFSNTTIYIMGDTPPLEYIKTASDSFCYEDIIIDISVFSDHVKTSTTQYIRDICNYNKVKGIPNCNFILHNDNVINIDMYDLILLSHTSVFSPDKITVNVLKDIYTSYQDFEI